MDELEREIDEKIKWISSFGGLKNGGTTRLLYTKEWLDAQKALKKEIENCGMEAYFDDIGNLFGRLEGTDKKDEVIATGSHIDTVVSGGKLDGQFGIIGGLIAINNLHKKYGKPKKTIELFSMAEEEGSRFPFVFWGSKNIFGLASEDDVKTLEDSKGNNFAEEMKKCGFTYNKGNKKREDIKAFIELHIEQGNTMEKKGKSVGVVTSIVGQRRFDITLIGEANHAGTTLMRYRKDAIQGYAKIVDKAIDMANEVGDPLVLTFGHVSVTPNTVNVVPGKVEFSMDCRHTDEDELRDFTQKIVEMMNKVADKKDLKIEIDMWMDAPPVKMDENIINTIESICNEKELNYMVTHSGAGHDSQIFGVRVPTGMIFVPSIDGISHNPKEDTKLEDLKQGVIALEETLYKLAY